MSFPIDQLAPDVAALFKHLECPVCLDVKADTLTICKSGHSAIVKRARNQVTFYLRRFNLIKRDVLSNRDQLRIGELGRDLNKTLEAIGTKLRAFVTVTGGYPFPGRMPEDCGYDAFGQVDHYGGDADNRWMERVLAM